MAGNEQGVFGIDLGTTYSAIAYIDATGRPAIIRNELQASDTTPSVVEFESANNIVVGSTAKEAAQIYPDRVVSLVKREMGNKDFSRQFHGKSYSAPAISALILAALAQDARDFTGRDVDKVVITVPAYFGTLEKASTRQAGEIASLDVLGVVPEPVAAAIAYGVATEPGNRTILVYDLGGGTFDVTIIRLTEDLVDSIVVRGDNHLGGADWDKALFEHLTSAAVDQIGTDEIMGDTYFVQDAWKQAEEVKMRLSKSESRPVVLRAGGGTANVTITRAEFEEMTEHLLQRTIDITRSALTEAEEKQPGITAEISDVLLVGGSTLMPAVSAALTREFGWQPRLSDPHLAVAKGAALYAAGALVRQIVEKGEDEDSTPLDERTIQKATEAVADEIGVDADQLRGIVQKTATRNRLPKAIGIEYLDTSVAGWESMSEPPSRVGHHVPAQAELPFDSDEADEVISARTVAAGQDGVRIALWEQASPEPSEELDANRPLETGTITGLAQYGLPAGSPIQLRFQISNEGEITVSATEPTSGKELAVTAQIALLSDEQVADARNNQLTLLVSR
ncbi:MAG TPA: Hsp70 family protein [Kribbella sp.]|jgi:molecular chaperone DnaK (HSP70)